MFFAGYAGVFHGKAAIMNNERIRNNDDEKNNSIYQDIGHFCKEYLNIYRN